jgi:WD40 repeat protein
VARDLAAEGAVLPSELQIVGERLQSKRIFSVREYKRLGGKEPLVESFLDDVIQASGDRAGCGLVLRAMISDENTRLTLSLQEIAHRTQRSHSATEMILKLLVSARLVREIQDEDPWRYEVMHEYLIEKVNRITGRVLDATQRANRLLRQYLSSYSVDKRTRIPISKLWFIRRYSDIERGERERELLRTSLKIGLVKACALVLLLAGAATVAAAALSVSEEWEGVRLSDGHTAAVRRAIFSPDGRLLASCGEDSKVIVWDFARRKRLVTLADHTDWVGAVAFSPDGKWLATGSFDKTIIVWDAASFEKVTVLEDHRGHVVGLAFSRDGQLLASVAEDHRLILWSVGQWQNVREFRVSVSQHTSLIFSPDGRYLIAPYESAVLDLATGERVAAIDRDWGGIWGAISPDGARIVSTDGVGNVTFFDLTRRRIVARHRAHRDNGRAVAFSPDGRLVATGSEIVILWDAATQTKLVRLEHTAIVWSVEFSPDGRWLVSTHGDGSILIWDVAERERIANLNEHSGPVRAVAFSPDGKLIASGGDDRSIIVWDVESGRKEEVLIGHAARVTATVFLPDAGLLAACDFDTAGWLWDRARGQPRWIVENSKVLAGSNCVAVSPDGRFIAASQGVYETAGGRQVFDAQEYKGESLRNIYGVSFSHDGRRLAFASAYGFISILDVENWQVLDKVEVIDTQLISLSFSPDDKCLVTGEDEGSVRLWEANPLRQVAVIGRHAARIKSVSFSPDGKEVASASDDQTIALWDVGKRRLITRIGTHTAPVLSITFSPDGKRLASGEHDKSVRIYTRHRVLWGYRLD